MMNSIEITGWNKDATISAIVKATFPSYKRRKVYVRAAETVMLQDLNWSGGTRSEYRACTLDGGTTLGNSEKYSMIHPWDNKAEGASVPIPVGSVMVRGGFFCGKESLLCIYVNPADMPKYLTKG